MSRLVGKKNISLNKLWQKMFFIMIKRIGMLFGKTKIKY
jgi:hypothetical protein